MLRSLCKCFLRPIEKRIILAFEFLSHGYLLIKLYVLNPGSILVTISYKWFGLWLLKNSTFLKIESNNSSLFEWEKKFWVKLAGVSTQFGRPSLGSHPSSGLLPVLEKIFLLILVGYHSFVLDFLSHLPWIQSQGPLPCMLHCMRVMNASE